MLYGNTFFTEYGDADAPGCLFFFSWFGGGCGPHFFAAAGQSNAELGWALASGINM
jgi:hypothetical protein